MSEYDGVGHHARAEADAKPDRRRAEGGGYGGEAAHSGDEWRLRLNVTPTLTEESPAEAKAEEEKVAALPALLKLTVTPPPTPVAAALQALVVASAMVAFAGGGEVEVEKVAPRAEEPPAVWMSRPGGEGGGVERGVQLGHGWSSLRGRRWGRRRSGVGGGMVAAVVGRAHLAAVARLTRLDAGGEGGAAADVGRGRRRERTRVSICIGVMCH